MSEKEIEVRLNTIQCLISHWICKRNNGKRFVREVPIDEKIEQLRKERVQLNELIGRQTYKK